MNLISLIQFSLSVLQIWNNFDKKYFFLQTTFTCGKVKLRLHWKILLRVQCVEEFYAQLLYWIVTFRAFFNEKKNDFFQTLSAANYSRVMLIEHFTLNEGVYRMRIIFCVFKIRFIRWEIFEFMDDQSKKIQNWTNERKVIFGERI